MGNQFANQEAAATTAAAPKAEASTTSVVRGAQKAPVRTDGRVATLANPNALLRRSVSRNPVSGAISTAIAAIENVADIAGEGFKRLLKENKLQFFPFDGEVEDADISALIVARREEDTVAAVAVTLRGTATDLGEIYIDDKRLEADRNATPIRIPRVPTDVFAESVEMRNRILDMVEEAFKEPQKEIDVELAGQIITAPGMDIGDIDEVRRIVYRAVEACESLLVDLGVIDSEEFNFNAVPADGKLAVRTKFGAIDSVDYLGNTFRGDVTIETVVRQNVDKNGRKSTRISPQTVARGFIDALYVGQDIENTRSQVWTEDNTQTFQPVFVITDLDTCVNAVTLTQLMFAIGSAGYLSDSNRWIAALNPIYANELKERFVGALGREVPMLDTQIRRGEPETMGVLSNDASFDYIEFCRTAFYLDRLVIALDIEEGGQLSPVQNIILDAAKGVRESEAAVVASLDFLFGGNTFSSIWEDAGKPALVTTDYTRIPLGYYIDGQGRKRDVRNIDMINLMNTVDDVQTIGKLTDAYYNQQIDEQRRISDAIEVLNTMNSTFELTGYAQRVFATPEFFDLFREAAESAHVSIGPDAAFDINRESRGNRAYLSRGVGSAGGLFQRRAAYSRQASTRSQGWGGWGGRSR